VTSVHRASPATLPTNPPEARSSPCLNPPQPLCPPRSTTELGRILEPGYLGSSGQWDMMRPQKGSISGDLSSGSSMCQLHSKPTEADLLEEHLGEIWNLYQHLEESICINDCLWDQLEHRQSRSETCCSELHTSVDHGEVGDEPVASPQDPAALPVNGHRRPGPAAKGRSDRSTATHCRVGHPGSRGMDMLSIPHTQLETDCYGSRGSSTEKAPSSTSSSLPSEEEKSWIVSTDRDLRRNPSPVA
ncbi:hypothetical protein JEQ12_020673, partial [Ovis aries]